MRKMYTIRLCVFVFLLAISSKLLSQANAVGNYSFTPSNTAYVPLVGGTLSTAVAGGDDGTESVVIGFPFPFGPRTYTNAFITTNGAVKLVSSTVTTFGSSWTNTFSNTATNRPIVGVLWDDNHPGTGTITYLTSGTSPNQKFTVEWSGIAIGNSGASANPTGTFKVTLHESGKIEMHYGTINAFNAVTASIGLNDSTSFKSVTPGAPATASSATANNSISSATNLTTGTLYTFVPPVVCGGAPVATISGPTVACSNFDFSLASSGPSSIGLTYQWQSSPVGANTFTNIPSATNANVTLRQTVATDYRLIVTCTNSAQSTTSPVYPVGMTTVGCPPANDSCQAAISLTVGNGICTTPLIGDLSLCDSTPGLAIPTCQTNIYNKKDIWYKAIVPLSGKLVVQTSAVNTTTTDLVMQAYTGNCGALTPIAGTVTTPSGNNIGCDDDGNTDPTPSSLHSRVVIDSIALAGQTVYFRVLPYSSASNAGQFAICAVQQIPLPLSSGIANACETSVPVNIDSARKYSTTPFVNAAGQIIGFIYPEGNKLGITTYSLYQNTAALVRNTSNGEFYLDRNYNITVANQPDVTVGRPLVTFYYTSVDSARFAIATGQPTLPGGLNITKNNDPCTGVYSGSGTFLAGLQGSGIALPNSIYFVQDTVSSFSSFYIHRGTAPLPISLLSFAGRKQDKTNMLEWSTASETNNKGFELQRSANGTDFTSIIFVNSKAIGGNSSAQLNYNFADVTPLAGTNYYRLKQVDKDGKFSMSQIVAIKGLKPTSLQLVNVYPNPTANKLNVNIESPVTENVTLFVTDMAGKTLINLRKAVAVGDNNIELNVSALPTGSYLIKAICANGCETTTAKFVKQ
jgi:hypothetical protein